MRFEEIEIRNFRAIKYAKLESLRDVVVIAGPNGCGKSCVFDALRLLKSVYGGYQQPNEWHQWFNELGYDINRNPDAFDHLLRDSAEELSITAKIRLAEDERRYLQQNIEKLSEQLAWQFVAPHVARGSFSGQFVLARENQAHRVQVEHQSRIVQEEAKALLAAETLTGKLTASRGRAETTNNVVLLLLFTLWRPHELGVVDYHGPHRQYQRERIGGINLDLESAEEKQRQHALYNSANKYSNIKSEMASAYIRDLIASERGEGPADRPSVIDTMKELFDLFFPGKEFLGARPTVDNSLSFPVRLRDGSEHDINDLSSGEKEILFGYLRLRNTAPKHSVILLDEPELHLNPRLIAGLPTFYHRHLGKALQNQIWLVTHSDAFLREAVGANGFSVFHMTSALATTPGQNQLRPLEAKDEAEQLIIELVGDLATYRPLGKLVIFEGENSEFDRMLTQTLFPEEMGSVNAISAGSKRIVSRLRELLKLAATEAGLHLDVFSITDRDSEGTSEPNTGALSWDVYHIENYLLESNFIHEVVASVGDPGASPISLDTVETWLKDAAIETLNGLVCHRLQLHTQHALHAFVQVKANRMEANISPGLHSSVANASRKVADALTNELSEDTLASLERQHRAELNAALDDGTWRQSFRGRDVLKRFVSKHAPGLKYEQFRNLIISRMREAEFQPPSMRRVLETITAENLTAAVESR